MTTKMFQGIQQDCMNIMDGAKEKLKSDFQMSGLTAKSLAETGDLLLLLDEKPSDLAKILLQSASRRLHEQIVMLQVIQLFTQGPMIKIKLHHNKLI